MIDHPDLHSLKAPLAKAMAALRSNQDRLAFLHFLKKTIESGDVEALKKAAYHKELKHAVGIREFIDSPDYLDMAGVIYPRIMEEIIEMNSGKYAEAVLTGAIGTGKTTIALISTAYQLYLLSLMDEPQRAFGLDPSSEIVFIFQSVTARLAKSVDFDRFKAMVEKAPYFQQHFRFDKEYLSELKFPNRIIVKPVSGSDTAAIGQNVIGGLIDELNFMAVTPNSKLTRDSSTYDQAIAIYNAISRRRKSRFMKQGKLPGILCLVSSKRYPGQFTDQKVAEAKREIETKGETSIFVYDKTTWDVKPTGTFSGDWFNIFVGDESRRPRLLTDDDILLESQKDQVIRVPEEYRSEFEQDIMASLRDIAGISTLARHPFIMETEKITAAMKMGLPSIFALPSVDFVEQQLELLPENITNPTFPRYAHVDLGLTGDSAGVVIGYVRQFKDVVRGDTVEKLPEVVIDGVLEVRPPRNGEILFWKIRDIFHSLRNHGMNIIWITYDSFQSADSIQLLNTQGFKAGRASMDTNPAPYEFLKSTMYDGRLLLPKHQKLQIELASLEKTAKTGRVDHPPHGSKDCADALAGVIYGLYRRREVWCQFRIPLFMMPPSVKAIMDEATDQENQRVRQHR